MSAPTPITVLFVCMGNICRSPMAEAVFRHLVQEAGLTEQIVIDSAGTGGWHAGEPPHQGTLAVLQRHGISADGQVARQITKADFGNFTYIVAMDADNLRDLRMHDPRGCRTRLLLDYAPTTRTREVPDPYYNGRFDEVYALVTAGCQGLLAEIRREHGL
ncbi:low molecular weight protein-tyrosine-phosphatase [Candidatus Oscillochloris fontis]|uniref:low molecular weight protein-tyrosine-phosphatase n=1 Tax=Candidatus Oscillochloris fontis TaxID=2496868 RepID=UPI00101C26B0|nr:low molecular weight protein-tyrosine-phosphatase [Candidatus Oscillochloris fontis]